MPRRIKENEINNNTNLASAARLKPQKTTHYEKTQTTRFSPPRYIQHECFGTNNIIPLSSYWTHNKTKIPYTIEQTLTGGTLVWTGVVNKELSNESVAYVDGTPDDMKVISDKAIKLGSGDAYLLITLTEGTIQEGDEIQICGYNKYLMSDEIPADGVKLSTTKWEVLTGADKTNHAVGTFTFPAGVNTSTLAIKRNSGSAISAIKIVRPLQDPSVKEYTIAGVEATIDQEAKTITAILPYGTTADQRIADILAATITLGGSATGSSYDSEEAPTKLTVTDGTNNVEYTLNITIDDSASDDNSLKSLSVNGTAIELVADQYAYSISIPYTKEIPVVAAEANHPEAEASITQLTTAESGNATVTVKAQNGAEQVYTITITIEEALKELTKVVLSNGLSAWVPAGGTDIHGYYLEGDAVPTVASAIVSTGATWKEENEKLIVTAEDGTTAEHTLVLAAVTPQATSEAITFDGTEAWVKTGSAFSTTAGKEGWIISKDVNDATNMRIWNGKSRLYFFLEACDRIILTNGGSARTYKAYVNGVEVVADNAEKMPAAGNEFTITVNQDEAFMFEISSHNTNGDGALKAIRFETDDDTATALENVVEQVSATKVIENGQLIIIRDGVRYNALGTQL